MVTPQLRNRTWLMHVNILKVHDGPFLIKNNNIIRKYDTINDRYEEDFTDESKLKNKKTS